MFPVKCLWRSLFLRKLHIHTFYNILNVLLLERVIMNTQRGILNFSKKLTRTNTLANLNMRIVIEMWILTIQIKQI